MFIDHDDSVGSEIVAWKSESTALSSIRRPTMGRLLLSLLSRLFALEVLALEVFHQIEQIQLEAIVLSESDNF